MNWSYLYTSIDGRISRRTFWLGFFPLLAAEVAVQMATQSIQGERLSAIADLAFAYPEFALFAKRAQDRGNEPWMVVIFLVLGVLLDFLTVAGLAGTPADTGAGFSETGGIRPNAIFVFIMVPWMVLAVALLIDLGFRSGSVGPNRFGPDPLQTRVSS